MEKITIPGYLSHEVQSNPHHANFGVVVECADASAVSDGYHTFGELYRHRCLLFLAFLKALNHPESFRARLHADGSAFEGWFIVGATLPGGQISYHLPNSMWELTGFLYEFDRAPEWDGHSSDDVCDRLEEWLLTDEMRTDAAVLSVIAALLERKGK